MSDRQRVTLSLPPDVIAEARTASGGNLSRFVTSLLRRDLEQRRRHELRSALVKGYQAESDLDADLSEAFSFVDAETAERFLPPGKETTE